jgi:hypothetical protein
MDGHLSRRLFKVLAYFTTISVTKLLILDCIMNGERRMENDLKGSGCDLIDLLFRYVPRQTKKNRDEFYIRPAFTERLSQKMSNL